MAYTLNRRLAQLVDSNGQLNTGKIPNDYITGDHIADNVITSAMLHTSFTVSTSNLTAIDTDDVSEGTSNLYFTNARVNAVLPNTDSLTEGSTNLYYTDARWDTKMAAADTDDLSEGSTNLYFTNARIDSHLSGGTGVTYSSGAISIGQDVGTTATPTFGNITTTGYIAGPATFTIDPAAVGDNTGTVVIAGNLQVDGTTTTVNSTTVEVSDKTIELGYDATTDAANNGAGIVVSRPETSDASFLWSETNERFETNKEFSVMEQFTINANGTNDNHIEIGGGTSNNHYAYVDLIGDSTYSDYGLRIIRNNSGANTSSVIHHRGTGAFVLETLEAGDIKLRTSNTDALIVNSLQRVGIGESSTGANLHVIGEASANNINDFGMFDIEDASDNGIAFGYNTTDGNAFIYARTRGTDGRKLILNNALTVSRASQGYVGIGTDSPSTRLHVAGETYLDNNSTFSSASNRQLTLRDSDNTSMQMYFSIDDSVNDGIGAIQVTESGVTNDRPLLLQYHGGNVGIGTLSPPEKFTVDGGGAVIAGDINSSSGSSGLFLAYASNISFLKSVTWGSTYRDLVTESSDFIVRTGAGSATEKLRVTQAGRVGIGTNNPSHGLTVSDALAGTSESRRITIQSTTHGVNAGYRFNTESANGTGRAGGLYYEPSDTAGASYIGLTGDDANSHLAVLESGNVGIGTTNPTGAGRILHLNSSSNVADFHMTNSVTGAASTDGFILRVTDPANVEYVNREATNQIWYQAGAEAMRINSSGNVGIGVTNPGYKLAVSSKLVVGDAPAIGLSGNTIHVREGSNSGIHYPLVIGGGTHVAGAAFGLAFDPEGYGNRNKIAILAEGIGAGYSRGRLHFALDSVSDSGQVTLAESKMCILENGNVGIGAQLDNAGHKLHVWGGSAHTNLAVTTNDGYKSEVRMMEDKAGTTHGGFIRYDGNGDYVQIGHYNNGTEMMGWSMDDAGNIALGATNASGHFEVHGGRMGIVSTDSSWEQLRVCNTSTTGEAGIAIFNGANSGEFLSDTQPIFSNAFTLAINPYGCGSDTLAIGHGNLTDSIWHIDGSGNFGYGPNTENPVSYYEISKTRPNVNAPSDYELKLTLNTYGYVGSNYKLGMLQFLGGDTAGAQDNFYAALSARAANGANNQEDGALQFHVKTAGYSDTLAAEFNGDNNPSSQIAGSGSVRNGMLFRWQGIAIDRSWGNYPGIAVMNSSDYSTNSATQAEFRVHGTNGSSSSYPSTSGSDFSVNFRVDGSYISGSDRRRKTNITTIDNALEKVNQLTGKRFQTVNRAGEVNENQSKADNYKFGLIAQEVEDIIPEATKYYEDEDDGTEGWNSSYSIDYPSLTALLINAIKEQDVVIQDLKSRIETLEG